MSELRVALTLDAEHPDRPWCPPGNAEGILDTLRERHVTATFFVQGRWAEAYPATAKRIADDGHLVGHHSHYHARMPLLLGGGFADDITDGAKAIEAPLRVRKLWKFAGVSPTLGAINFAPEHAANIRPAGIDW